MIKHVFIWILGLMVAVFAQNDFVNKIKSIDLRNMAGESKLVEKELAFMFPAKMKDGVAFASDYKVEYSKKLFAKGNQLKTNFNINSENFAFVRMDQNKPSLKNLSIEAFHIDLPEGGPDKIKK